MAPRVTRAAARSAFENADPKQVETTATTATTATATKTKASAQRSETVKKPNSSIAGGSKANTSRKRKLPDSKPSTQINSKDAATPSKRTRKTPTKAKAQPSEADLAGGAKMASAWMKVRDDQFAEGAAASSSLPAKNAKANPYNLTPGASPYPSFSHPTPAECQEVADVLSRVHGRVSAPKTVPVPSLNSSGCGEVPSVLDALIRTRLSAATNGANSSRAFRGLVERFGVIKEGVGMGSVDWDKVRTADVGDVFEAIRSGGLADVKSRDIKKILQLVYDENQARRAELQKDGAGAAHGWKEKAVIERAEANVVSLDHLHELSSADAFNKLLQYPGIGPKTASCVLLFCMQRPSFAVDTHVFRLTRWLGWTPSDAEVRRMGREMVGNSGAKAEAKEEKVKIEDGTQATTPGKSPTKRVRGPPPVTRNSTYSHLDVRIPDELKYALHYLLIKHGKTCPSCSAKPDRAVKEAWGDKECPLKGLKGAAKARGRGKSELGDGADGEDGDVEEGEEEVEVKEDEDDDDDEE